MCVNRFDEETKNAFLDLYTKVDAKPVEQEYPSASVEEWMNTLTTDTGTPVNIPYPNGPTNVVNGTTNP
jgi:hypothetical protein